MNPIKLVLFFSVLTSFACLENHKASEQASPTGDLDSSQVMETSQQVFVDTFPKDFLLGQFEPRNHPDFVRIDDAWSAGSGRGAFLHKDAYRAFVQMAEAAKADGINLTIISATRNFYRQKEIWEAKWNGERMVEGQLLPQTMPDPEKRALFILRYSSMPGTSRHHWGTDFDLNDLENSYFASGKGKAEYDWLVAHAAEFGFCQPYTPKGSDRPFGYEEEKWHWSFQPLAEKLTAAYAHQISSEDIGGFDGAEAAAGIDVINRYVLGVNLACK